VPALSVLFQCCVMLCEGRTYEPPYANLLTPLSIIVNNHLQGKRYVCLCMCVYAHISRCKESSKVISNCIGGVACCSVAFACAGRRLHAPSHPDPSSQTALWSAHKKGVPYYNTTRNTHTHTRTRAHTHKHTHSRSHTQTQTHTQYLKYYIHTEVGLKVVRDTIRILYMGVHVCT
jgi:ABC-type nickel/cobalt efflux system permease component RcnA